jgi:hypothetical protein
VGRQVGSRIREDRTVACRAWAPPVKAVAYGAADGYVGGIGRAIDDGTARVWKIMLDACSGG